MKKIKLENASKDEIIQAIKSEFAISDVADRIEKAILHLRVKSLLDKVGLKITESQLYRQPKDKPFDRDLYLKWDECQRDIDKLNEKLNELQGI